MNKSQNHNALQNKLDTKVHLVCFSSHKQVKLICNEKVRKVVSLWRKKRFFSEMSLPTFHL